MCKTYLNVNDQMHIVEETTMMFNKVGGRYSLVTQGFTHSSYEMIKNYSSLYIENIIYNKV